MVFENKKDAVRAMSKCVEQPFMIGQSSKPVKVEWARLDVSNDALCSADVKLTVVDTEIVSCLRSGGSQHAYSRAGN